MSSNSPSFEKPDFIAPVEPEMPAGGKFATSPERLEPAVFALALVAGFVTAVIGSAALAAFIHAKPISLAFIGASFGRVIAGVMMSETKGVSNRRIQLRQPC